GVRARCAPHPLGAARVAPDDALLGHGLPEVDALARRALDGHASVEIGRRATPAQGIEHVIVAVDKVQKRGVLAKILRAKPAGQTLVFTRTKYGADKLVTFLRKDGIPAHAI